jgi:hypothetical protein
MKLSFSREKKFTVFKETEDSQQPSTVPIPNQINTVYTTSAYVSPRSILILSSHFLIFPVDSFLLAFTPITYTRIMSSGMKNLKMDTTTNISI